MFTKRSILVGFVVLFAARLVGAAASQHVVPYPGAYLLDDGISRKARNAGLNDWLAETMKLGPGIPFNVVAHSNTARSPLASASSRRSLSKRYPNSGRTVTLDFFSTGGELLSHEGNWGHIAYDPMNPTSLVVSNCTIDGVIPPGMSWSGGDFLEGGGTVTLTAPSLLAAGASGVGQVSFYSQPADSGAACQPLGGLVETLTDTGFGDAVEIIGTNMWVNRTQNLSSSGVLQGGFDVFDLSFTLTSVDATLVGSVEGTGNLQYYGATVAELNGAYLVAGSPYDSPPKASVFGVSSVITATASVDHLGSFVAPVSMLGSCVENAGDVNDDNFDDILVCSSTTLYIVCGKTLVQAGGATLGAGAVVAEIPPPDTAIGFATSVLANVDYNGDGVPDVAVSAPYFDPHGLNNAGRVYVYEGATGALLTYFNGREAGDQLGGGGRNSIISLGDVGARDGRLDFAFGAPGHDARFFLTTTMVTYTGDIDLRPSTHPFPRTNFKSLLEPFRLLGFRFLADR